MSEQKHTPGPWGWCEGEPGNSEYPPEPPSVGPEDSDGIVCWLNDREEPAPTWHANARLIAAAPDLLAAAKEVMAELDARIRVASASGTVVPVFAGIAALSDAIHKAEEGGG